MDNEERDLELVMEALDKMVNTDGVNQRAEICNQYFWLLGSDNLRSGILNSFFEISFCKDMMLWKFRYSLGDNKKFNHIIEEINASSSSKEEFFSKLQKQYIGFEFENSEERITFLIYVFIKYGNIFKYLSPYDE